MNAKDRRVDAEEEGRGASHPFAHKGGFDCGCIEMSWFRLLMKATVVAIDDFGCAGQ